MKLFGSVIFALILSGCASPQSISFSPSREYAISVQSSQFDAVRTDTNDITLFLNGKAAGFVRIEPVPDHIDSAKEFLQILQSATESENIQTKPLNVSTGFTGFAAENHSYLTGYLTSEGNPDSILVVSFPEKEFEEIVATVTAGI